MRVPEIAHGAGRGAYLDLRAAPSEDSGMSPREIWCNEAQERYVLAIAPASLGLFRALCERERCPFAVLGKATADGRLKVKDPRLGDTPVDVDLQMVLGKPPKMLRDVKRLARAGDAFALDGVELKEAAYRVLRHPAVADKTFLIAIGDRTVGGLCSRDPFVGPWQVPVADCAVTLIDFDNVAGEAFAIGERTPLASVNAPASGRMAVGEAITNIAAARISSLDRVKLSANWMAAAGSPGEDAALYDTVQAVAIELCPSLGVSIPVGKDSLVHAHGVGGQGGGGAGVAHRVRVRAGGGRARHADAAAAHRCRRDGAGAGGFGPGQEPAGRVDPRAGAFEVRHRGAGPGGCKAG